MGAHKGEGPGAMSPRLRKKNKVSEDAQKWPLEEQVPECELQ